MHDRSYRRSSVWLVCLFSMVTPCSVAVTLLVTSLTSSIGLTTYPNGDAAVRSPLISAGAVPPPPEGATTSSYGLAAAQAMGCGSFLFVALTELVPSVWHEPPPAGAGMGARWHYDLIAAWLKTLSLAAGITLVAILNRLAHH